MDFLKSENGVRYFEVPLDENGNVYCWFSTRHSDISGGSFKQDFDGNFLKILTGKGVDISRIVTLKQVHESGVMPVSEETLSGKTPGDIGTGDALITDLANTPLVIKTADCLSIQIWDSSSGAIANIHCGWRSGAKNIIALAIVKMMKLYGFKPGTAKAVLMPSICRESYPVGDDVRNAYIYNINGMEPYFSPLPDGSWLFDLRAMAADLLQRAGIKKDSITDIDDCTLKNADLFYSYRRDGKATGRMFSFIVKRN